MSQYAIEMQQQPSSTQPISRTLQYRKVMKPMLERKRRARINRCLDELKDLMVSALATDGENVSKLEKADILELTVAHLQKLKRQQCLSANPTVEADRFRSGFTTCAKEVSKCLASIPGVDVHLGTQLMTHLGHSLKKMDSNTVTMTTPLTVQVAASSSTTTSSSAYINTPPASPVSSSSSESEGVVYYEQQAHQHQSYAMPLTPSSARSSPSPKDYSVNSNKSESVWRPW